MALSAQSWLELRPQGFHEMVATATEEILTLVRGLGFVAMPLAPGKWYCGEMRAPFQLDMLSTMRGLVALWGSAAYAAPTQPLE
jgi:hypothetical protein